MSDPDPSQVGPAPVLGYVVDPTHRSTGPVKPWAIALVLAGGLVGAACAAAVAMTWILSKTPTWLILPFIAQGLLVGGTLIWLGRRLGVRERTTVIVLAAVCGCASAAFFYAGLYVRNVYSFQEAERRQWTDFLDNGSGAAAAPTAAARAVTDDIAHHPFARFDRRVLVPRVGHRGFVGYLILRGPRIWWLAIVQVGTVVFLAVRLGQSSANRPYCTTCRAWFREPKNVIVLPASYTEPLTEALRTEDVRQLLQLSKLEDVDLGSVCVVARVYECRSCGERLAEVALKGGGDKLLVPPRRVSADAVAAMKGQLPTPVEPLEDPGPHDPA